MLRSTSFSEVEELPACAEQEAKAAIAAADRRSGLHIHYTDAARYMSTVLAEQEASSSEMPKAHYFRRHA